MKLHYYSDPAYPPGAAHDPNAPYNQPEIQDYEFRCDDCGDVLPLDCRAQGTGYCVPCAKDRHYRECDECGTSGHCEQVAEKRDSAGLLCVQCATKQGFHWCDGCGLFARSIDAQSLCDECQKERAKP